MTWLSKLRTALGHDEPLLIQDDHSVSKQESANALRSAKEAYEEAQRRREEARAVTSTLSELNVANHYGESIYLAMLPREKRA